MTVTSVRRRGIAILMTLVVIALLSVLLGAFVTVNRANSSITGNVVIRQQAYNACLSGLHYTWAELESDSSFGADGFPNGVTTVNIPPVGPAEVQIRIYGNSSEPENPELNYIEGEILSNHDTFEVKLVNNLTNRNVKVDSSLGDIPGHCARLEVIGVSGQKNLKLSSVLRKSPYVDSSALSSYDMNIELSDNKAINQWSLRSKDPYVNQVRSNMDINGPSAVDGNLKFSNPPRGGVAKAQSDIVLGDLSVGDDPAYLGDSQEAANGSFQVGAGEIEVPDLSRDQLTFPPTKVEIPPGEMEMGVVEEVRWIEMDVGGESKWNRQVVSRNKIEHSDQIWISETYEHKSQSGPIYDQEGDDGGIPGHPNPGEFSDRHVLYDDGNDDSVHKMEADLITGEITLSPGTTFEVDGSLEIKQNDDAPQAHLLFGYEFRGPLAVFAGSSNALEDAADNSAVLSTEGDLFIDGITTGFGSLYADGEVDLRAKSGLRAEQDLAVAVHGNKINFTAEEPPEASQTNTLSQSDFLAYQDAMGPQYDEYEDWWNLELGEQLPGIGFDPDDTATGLRNKRLDEDGDYYWNKIMIDLERDDNPPDFGSYPGWSDNLSLEQFVRLQNYAKTRDSSWLDMPGSKYDLVTDTINQRLNSYSGWAHRMNLSISDYMQEPLALIADFYFVGLVHAGDGGFNAYANNGSVLFEGALVSQGQLNINQAKALDFVYNRTYLDDVVKEFRGSSRANLDQVYYRLQ
jgi:hypothetical protein